MENKAIVRMEIGLSYAGRISKGYIGNEPSIDIKPSEKSNLRIMCPLSEVIEIILPSGKNITAEEFYNEY